MTLTLILTRHAKSSWSHTGPDHTRRLNARGRASAPLIAKWLRDQRFVPDQIISSNATRTGETIECMNLGVSPTLTRDLYLAEAKTMLGVLRQATGLCTMMVGHNPGIAEFAERLVTVHPAHPRFFDYPTCATTVMTFPINHWKNVSFGIGQVETFMIPRDLAE